jgi:hypothetical protein
MRSQATSAYTGAAGPPELLDWQLEVVKRSLLKHAAILIRGFGALRSGHIVHVLPSTFV